MSDKKCPQCNKEVTELIRLDADLKSRLKTDVDTTAPESVCQNCYNGFAHMLSKEAHKKSRRVAKEQHRLSLWRSRVQLIREARDRFAAKDFPGAVMAYEKYFRVLEIIYEVKSNEIQVAHFNNSARSKELVVIASAYWDLMRIYDQSKKFGKRLDQCAVKLGEFLPFTPIFSEITRKIEDYKKTAKNKEPFDKVLKLAHKGKGRCFIATAAYESSEAGPVVVLRRFRDIYLTANLPGRFFLRTYYFLSPPLATVLDHSSFLRQLARSILDKLANKLDIKYNLKSRS